MPNGKRIALLIDCDNVSHNSIEGVLEELAKYGMVNVRHAHGDWNNPSLSGWADKLHPHAIRPMQQFAYTKGKNATDSAMIIDAMDLLYSKNIDAFALMTSDSDFTPLVLRILESGMPVYGFGEKKTPEPFVAACDKFIFTEVLRFKDDDDIEKMNRKTTADLKRDTKLVNLLRNAVDASSDDSGWAHLAAVGSNIAKQSSEFDPRNYGYKKLGGLIAATKLFQIEERSVGDGTSKAIYLKDTRKK